MDLGVVDGRDLVAVPDPTRGGGDQASEGLSDAVLVPGAVLGEGFQGLPGGGLLQGQDRLGDRVFLDVQRHGGNPLGEAVEAAAGEGPSEGLQQGLPDGPGEFSLGHDASPVSGQLGLSPPGRFRPGDATFQYGTPAQLLYGFSWKLLPKNHTAFRYFASSRAALSTTVLLPRVDFPQSACADIGPSISAHLSISRIFLYNCTKRVDLCSFSPLRKASNLSH